MTGVLDCSTATSACATPDARSTAPHPLVSVSAIVRLVSYPIIKKKLLGLCRVVFEAEASGGSKAGGLPHPSFSLSPPLPLSIPLSFQTNQSERRSDPVRGKFPGFPPPYKYHPGFMSKHVVSRTDVPSEGYNI